MASGFFRIHGIPPGLGSEAPAEVAAARRMPHMPAWQATRRQGQSRQRAGCALSGMRR
ncbi:hypothetical protein CBM2588_A50081 [Cupriavidus taiwanensis]|nr:hypothetical protein CBM2588_A50081 [Cupriavidus taiwanensis]